MLNQASGELTVELVSGILVGFAAATGSAAVQPTPGAALEELVDVLDLFLEQLIDRGVLKASDLKPDGVGARVQLSMLAASP